MKYSTALTSWLVVRSIALTRAASAGEKPSARARAPVCLTYRDHDVCGMGPPSSGGLTTLMILGTLEHYRMGKWRPNAPTALHLIAQASRLKPIALLV